MESFEGFSLIIDSSEITHFWLLVFPNETLFDQLTFRFPNRMNELLFVFVATFTVIRYALSFVKATA